MDGTLIDTEKYYHVCWMQAVKHFGYPITEEQAYHLRSLGRPYVQQYFRKLYGDSFDYDEVHAYRKKLTDQMFADKGIELKPGVVEALKFLKDKNITMAIATATDMERTIRYLKELGILDYFDRVVSARMVERGKPAPDVYLYACGELGLEPSECLAVEDSPNGVQSAVHAGCKVVMVPDQTEPDEQLSKLLYAKIKVISEIKQLFQ
jgi:DNA helicase-2/ATP-dependent DNA helicase PcrA